MDQPSSLRREPHLTPANLIGRQFGRDFFHPLKVALVGYCPRPAVLDKYQTEMVDEQCFIHIPPSSVELCQHKGLSFLSVVHVYGGPVSSALVEELAYYGFTHILAYGLAGGLGVVGQEMGQMYIVERALARDGTTPSYTDERVVSSDRELNRTIMDCTEKANMPVLMPVQTLTTDAIYREYESDLQSARESGCHIVNCDSSHLFAASRVVGIKSTECGVLSDVAGGSGEEWQSALSVMLNTETKATLNPLALTGQIVEFYVETVLAAIMTPRSKG